jgi:putative protein-disulfide isomerase
MYSWCWGFAPVIDAIKEAYADQLKVALLLGGLRPEIETWLARPA